MALSRSSSARQTSSECTWNWMWFCMMFCSWSVVPEIIWSEKGLSSTSWLQQCYHLKSSCPVAKNKETIFTPLHQLYCTSNDHPVTAHMLPHITPLNVPTECVTFSFLMPATSLLLQSPLPVSYHCGTPNFKQFHRKNSNRPKSSDQAGHTTCSIIPIHLPG